MHSLAFLKLADDGTPFCKGHLCQHCMGQDHLCGACWCSNQKGAATTPSPSHRPPNRLTPLRPPRRLSPGAVSRVPPVPGMDTPQDTRPGRCSDPGQRRVCQRAGRPQALLPYSLPQGEACAPGHAPLGFGVEKACSPSAVLRMENGKPPSAL